MRLWHPLFLQRLPMSGPAASASPQPAPLPPQPRLPAGRSLAGPHGVGTRALCRDHRQPLPSYQCRGGFLAPLRTDRSRCALPWWAREPSVPPAR